MQHSALILILALVAGIQARDDWSWGPDSDGSGSSSSASSSASSPSISGRSLTFPSTGRDEDHKLASSLRSQVVQSSFQGAPAVQTGRAPRVIQAVQSFPAAQALNAAPAAQGFHSAPAAQAFQTTQTAQGFHGAPAAQAFKTTQSAQRFQAAQVAHSFQTASAAHAVQPAPATIQQSVTPQAVGTSLKGENRNDNQHGDGQAEGRFLGIKEKLCGVGIGFDCKKGYDSHGHNGGNGLSVYDVSYVQPIAVIPIGGHIAAVPVKKGHHKGHHSPPAYHPPQPAPAYHPPPQPAPAYHPPQAPVSGYGAPRPTYSAPRPSYGAPRPSYGAPSPSYGAPAPAYHPPKATYSPPVSSYASSSLSSYTPPKSSYVHGSPTIVKHEHTHHHIYNSPSSQGGYGLGKDNSFSATSSSNLGSRPNSHFNTFSSSIKKVGSVLPAIPPRQGFLTSNTQRPAYLEDCQCVERRYCPSFDIVGRSNDLLPLLDARTRTTDILSTADEDNAAAGSSEADDDFLFSASETNTVVEGAAEASQSTDEKVQNSNRKKRDTLSIVVDDIGVQPADNPTSRQSRQFKFTGYTPGLSGCAASHICCRTPVFRSQRDAGSCGRRSSVGLLGRVKNTRFEKGDTEFGEYPWQAAILRKEGIDNVYVCGAVLIDTRHLLTAAHCINGINPTELKVRLGEWDVSSETEFYGHIESPVSGVYTHPEFYSGNLNNDIAVLRLFSPVDMITNPHISPVCLPDRFADFTGQRCRVTGWGKNAFGTTGDFQHLLKEVELPMVHQSVCQSALRQTRLGSQFLLHQGMVCAGGEEGKDACEGDGGSPLVCRDRDGLMMLTGLVSWGVGCGTRGVPGVYTNIPHYLSWISSITKV